MQDDIRPLRLLLPYAVSRIVEGLPPEMSGSMKAQHIGVYCILLSMHLNNVLVTRRAICDAIGMADTHVGPKLRVLLELNLITTRKSPSPYGNKHRAIFEPVLSTAQMRALEDVARAHD
jgi:hypothetical protein